MKMNIKSLLKNGAALGLLLLSTESFGAAPTITIPGILVDDSHTEVTADVASFTGRKTFYAVDNAVTNSYAISVGANAVLELVAVHDGHHASALTQSGTITLANGVTIRLAGNVSDPSITIAALTPSSVTGAKLDIVAKGVVLPDLASFTGLDVEVNGTAHVDLVGKIGGALTVADGVTATLDSNITEVSGGLKGAGTVALEGGITFKGATTTFTGTLTVANRNVTLEYPFKDGYATITTGTLSTTKTGTIKKVTTGGAANMAPQDNLTITTLDLTGGNCTFATLAGKKVTISAIANQGTNFPVFSSGTFEVKDTITVGNGTWTIGGGKGTVKKVVMSDPSNSTISSADDLVIEELDITAATTAVTLNPAAGKTITVKKLTGVDTGVSLVISTTGTVVLPTAWIGLVGTNNGTLKVK